MYYTYYYLDETYTKYVTFYYNITAIIVKISINFKSSIFFGEMSGLDHGLVANVCIAKTF